MKTKTILKKVAVLVGMLMVLVSINGIGYAIVMEDGKDETKLPIIEERGGLVRPDEIKRQEPEYAPGEVIIKLKEPEASQEALFAQPYSVTKASHEDILSNLKSKYNLKDEKPVFEGLHNKLKAKNLSLQQLNAQEEAKLPQQAAKRPQDAKQPNLLPIYILKTDKDVLETCEKLKADPDVEYAEPNYIMEVQMVPNDPYYASSGSWGQPYDDLWGIKKLQCEQAWDISQGEGVVVAVIDTGVDYNHEDIAQNIWINEDEIPNNNIDDDNNGYVDDVRGWDFAGGDNDPMDGRGHGTHVSGTIAAIGNNDTGVIGVAPRAKIMVIKGLSDAGSGYISDLVKCIQYAADNNADVLSNSWGGTGISQVLTNAFNYAYNRGCISVAAAGNSNADVSNSTPANIDTVIAVAATNQNDEKCYFSNYGEKIKVAAPGYDILSLYPHTLPLGQSRAIVNVISDNNKKLSANVMKESAVIPASGITAEIIYANLGWPEDFAGLNVSGKLALMIRGELYFSNKVLNAYNAGAIGAIIYNNVTGNFNGTLQTLSEIPAISLSMEDGEYLKNILSSVGATLGILPVEFGYYISQMGTSMACPHVAGLVALLKNKYPTDTQRDIIGRLMAGADNIGGLNPEFPTSLGTGRINAVRSLSIQPQPALKLVGIRQKNFLPGKDGTITISMRNFWQAASNVVARLSTNHPGVIIQNNTVSFGDILLNETKTNENSPFTITLDQGINFGEVINFTLTVTYNGTHEKVFYFTRSPSFFENLASSVNLPLNAGWWSAISADDYNNDGFLDIHVLYSIGLDSYKGLYKNDQHNSFVNVTSMPGISSISQVSSLFIDIDNDLDQDWFMGARGRWNDEIWDWEPDNRLFLNNGNGAFNDITSASGINNTSINKMGIPIDYDNDGFLDIVAYDDMPNNAAGLYERGYIHKNNGNRTFTSIDFSSIGLTLTSYTLTSYRINKILSFDYDNDGDPDLLFLSLLHLVLYRNNGDGTFTNVSNASLLYRADDVNVGDYDNDSYIDLFLLNKQKQRGLLLKNNGDGTFVDVTERAGGIGLGTYVTNGAGFFDYDNDGDIDLYLPNRVVTPNDADNIPKNRLYRNNGDGTFTDITNVEGVFPYKVAPDSGAACMLDYNNDGAIDIYAPVGMFGKIGAFLENQIGTAKNWIALRLQGTVSNATAIGARVYVTAGGLRQMREIHKSSVETQPLHFGLSDNAIIDEIEIHWPSGIVQRLNNITANQHLTVTEPNILIPRITSISPKAASVGDTVTIIGKNFGSAQGNGAIDFYGSPQALIQRWSDAEIICTVPQGAANGNVSVITSAGRSNGVYFRLLTDPFIIPLAPSNLNILTPVTPYSAILKWEDNSNNETGFKIERSSDGTSFREIDIVEADTTIYWDTGFHYGDKGSTYYYRVRAYNGTGNSLYSTTASGAICPPKEPRINSAIGVSETEINLTWVDNSNNEQSFNIYRSRYPMLEDYTKISTLPPDTISYTDTGLTSRTRYGYVVVAYHDAGSSSSQHVEGKTQGPNRYPPILSPIGNKQVTEATRLVFVISATDGDGDALIFSASPLPAGAYFSSDGLFVWTPASEQTGDHIITFTASDGELSDSETVTITVNDLLILPAPSNLNAIAASPTMVKLTWLYNLPYETGFKIEKSLDGTNFNQIATVAADVEAYYVKSLTTGNTYYFRVAAYKDNAVSEYSNTASCSLTSPIAPSNLTAQALSSTKIKLTWQDNSDNERGFKVEISADGTTFTLKGGVGINKTTYTVGGLTPNTTYYFRVYAYNVVGKAYSEVTQGTTLPLPVAPSNLTATALSSTKIKLTWQDNSSDETGFKVEMSTDGTTYVTKGSAKADITTRTISKLTPNTTYYFRAYSIRGADKSAYSEVVQGTTLPLPVAPSNLTATALSSTKIKLTWQDNSLDETGFKVEMSTDGTTFVAKGSAKADITTCTISKLTPNTTYYFRVYAIRGSDKSAYSETIQGTTLPLPIAPTNLTAQAISSTKIQLIWQDNSFDETGFRVEMSSDGITFSSKGSVGAGITTYTAGGLITNTLYYFRVYAYRGADKSTYSNVASGTTQ